MDEVLRDLRAFIAHRVREGFEPVHDIVEGATRYARERHGRDDLRPEVRRLTAELLASHRAEQAGWEGSTDCDRLDEAFASLNRQGVVARQDFSCCNTCGFAEIWDEVEEEGRRPVEGYVFYHLQCTETAIESGQLLMAYGCVGEDAEALGRVAVKIVAELRRAGLNARWGAARRGTRSWWTASSGGAAGDGSARAPRGAGRLHRRPGRAWPRPVGILALRPVPDRPYPPCFAGARD